jgi:chemotaxis protein histidine kinase CheA
MEKAMGENEIKGLEEEIDSAVDRLFVEKKGRSPEGPVKKPTDEEPLFRMEKDVDLESPIQPSSPVPPFSRSIEKMESQLLSLEWEITKENLGKTREEVLAFRESVKDKPNITSVLGLMEKVLDYMIKNEEKIEPPLVKFLMDSKETIRLLMKKEADRERNTYKELAYAGIQARYSSLEELKEVRPRRAPLSSREETERDEIPARRDKRIDEILYKMDLFLEKVEEFFRRFDQHMVRPEESIQGPFEQLEKASALPMNITVVRVGGKFFGVESDKVSKLFKVPSGFHEKYASQQRIRLKDFEVRLIDLRKIFSIPKGDGREELKILAVKDDAEYKGLMIDQVLERLSTLSDIGEAYGEYFLGLFRWTYQERPMEVPILDLGKF